MFLIIFILRLNIFVLVYCLETGHTIAINNGRISKWTSFGRTWYDIVIVYKNMKKQKQN